MANVSAPLSQATKQPHRVHPSKSRTTSGTGLVTSDGIMPNPSHWSRWLAAFIQSEGYQSKNYLRRSRLCSLWSPPVVVGSSQIVWVVLRLFPTAIV